MKYLLALLMAICSLSCNTNTTHNQAVANADDGNIVSGVVNVATFVKLMEKDHLILDVRTPEEFAEGHIVDATHINFYDDDFAQRATALEKDKPILVYCKKGGRSAKAFEILKKAGFEEVYDLDGGYTAWQRAKQSVTK